MSELAGGQKGRGSGNRGWGGKGDYLERAGGRRGGVGGGGDRDFSRAGRVFILCV